MAPRVCPTPSLGQMRPALNSILLWDPHCVFPGAVSGALSQASCNPLGLAAAPVVGAPRTLTPVSFLLPPQSEERKRLDELIESGKEEGMKVSPGHCLPQAARACGLPPMSLSQAALLPGTCFTQGT